MKQKEKKTKFDNDYFNTRDKKMDSIGVPINPKLSKAKKSLWVEFVGDLGAIILSVDSFFGVFIAIFMLILVVIHWGLFLIGKFVFRIRLDKPNYKDKRDKINKDRRYT